MRIAALIAALALLLTACGGDEGGGEGGSDPVALLTAAIAKSDESSSYESTFELTSDLGGVEMEGSGRLISNADSTKARGPVKFTQDGEEIGFQMILLDDVMYMRTDELPLPDGKTWLRMQDDELAQQSLTPNQFTDLLRDSPDVEEVGREDVRGKPTVHLRGPLDLQEAAERAGGPVKELMAQPRIADRLSAQVDVWIGEQDDRLERVAMELKVDGEPGAMRISGDILQYDVSLDSVKAPPDGEVVDEADVPGMG